MNDITCPNCQKGLFYPSIAPEGYYCCVNCHYVFKPSVEKRVNMAPGTKDKKSEVVFSFFECGSCKRWVHSEKYFVSQDACVKCAGLPI